MTGIIQADIDAAKVHLKGTGPWKLSEIGIDENDPLVRTLARYRVNIERIERERCEAKLKYYRR